MSRVCYAFDKLTSPVKRAADANVIVHPETEYMATCQFTNIYWTFDKDKNYAPVLRLDGEVERLDVIKTKFPHNFDTLYFGDNKPRISYDYAFDNAQLAELAKKGFWSGQGVVVSEKLTTAKLQLETKAVVEELSDTYDKDKIPTFNVSLVNAYDNQFDNNAYTLAPYVMKKPKEEAVKIVEDKILDQEMNIDALVEKSKELLEAEKAAAQQASYKPKTAEEIAAERASANVAARVNAERDAIKARREENNARIAAEKAAEEARIKAEREAAEKAAAEAKVKSELEVKEAVEIKSDDVRNLTGGIEQNKYEDNSSIFNDNEDTNTELPDNIAELMKKLGGGQTTEVETATEDKTKKDDNSGTTSGTQNKLVYTFENNENEVKAETDKTGEANTDKNGSADNASGNNDSNGGSNSDNNSGAASGAQGLGVYTFEDRDTAQFDVRSDVNGSETEEDKKEEAEEKREEEKKEDAKTNKIDTESDMIHKKARLESTINETTVTTTVKDKDERSR